MAFVDLNTGKIYGTKKGSPTYFHEKGHIYFNSKSWGVRISYYGTFFQMISVIFLGVNLFVNSIFLKVFIAMNIFGMIFSYVFEEVFCWVWGLKEWRKSKR